MWMDRRFSPYSNCHSSVIRERRAIQHVERALHTDPRCAESAHSFVRNSHNKNVAGPHRPAG